MKSFIQLCIICLLFSTFYSACSKPYLIKYDKNVIIFQDEFKGSKKYILKPVKAPQGILRAYRQPKQHIG